MATLRQIKEQQTSIKTINKITKAMKLVSSAKSQKSVKALNEYKDYFMKVQNIIADLVDDKKTDDEFSGTYWILIMSDLGLAGGYNNNILKTAIANLKDNDELLILGNKGAGFAKRNKDKAEWFALGNLLEGNQLAELTTRIKAKHYDSRKVIKFIYTEYESQMTFVPVVKTILPIIKENLVLTETIEKNDDVKPVIEYEPEKDLLLKELESLYINSFLVGTYKESQASEHTARKNAMENATQNGEELLEKLDIEFNRGRQAKITQEISEIISGSESVK